MPAANHPFYLRDCYLDNKLAKGEMEIAGVTLDLSKVKVPVYNLATREDHIAPAKSVLVGSQLFGGEVATFSPAPATSPASSIRPPSRNTSTGPAPAARHRLDAWAAKATEHAGSWWPDWLNG